ncbi:MAG: hypothetical protein ACXACY_23125 [Candidatus Hodarchaeales archaeon]|jgi:hypothetical protein
MIKLAVGLIVVGILAFGIMAYAQGPGWVGGNMMGQGYGGHMTGPKMGWRGSGYDQKFLDETSDVRKELHNKKFEYFEATRDPETKPDTIAKLEKETRELQEKLYAKAPRSAYGGSGGFGCSR